MPFAEGECDNALDLSVLRASLKKSFVTQWMISTLHFSCASTDL
jgi:hypothetical protein